jgi:hypothetical protein
MGDRGLFLDKLIIVIESKTRRNPTSFQHPPRPASPALRPTWATAQAKAENAQLSGALLLSWYVSGA